MHLTNKQEGSLAPLFKSVYGEIETDLKEGVRIKNIFYFGYINSIGGIETFFYNLSKKYKDWDITIYYGGGDVNQINRIKKHVRCIQYNGEKIKCDHAYYNFNIDIIDNVEAKEHIQILHGDYRYMIEKPPTHPKITRRIAVSHTVADGWYELTGEKTKVIYNPMFIPEAKKILTLISPTRLTSDKGKHRMIKLADMLDKKKIPYVWYVFTDDTGGIDNPNMVYMKPTLDIAGWIKKADYLVQLSNAEGYCYSIVESLALGTPVITTDIPVVHEIGVKHGINGFITDFELNNLDIDEIYNSELKFEYTPKTDTWDKELAKGKSTYQFKESELLQTNEEWKPITSKLSVIIPVYNQEELIVKALDSIPKRPDIEIIVIDDGSTDRTKKSVIDYDYKYGDGLNIRLLANEKNMGVSYTVNKGLDNATGEYIVLLGSDDYFYTEELEKVLDQLDGTDLVYFDLKTNDGTILKLNPKSKTGLCGSVKCMRKQFIGDTRNIVDKKVGEDWFFYQELLKKQPTEKFTHIVAKHYNYPRENSISDLQRKGEIE